MFWIALFSQTGSEIRSVIDLVRIKPNLILTNNSKTEKWIENFQGNNLDGETAAVYSQTNDIFNYLREAKNWLPEQHIITLHGFMRIIPEDICNQLNVFNGHPGLITKFPELKGKDPQEKVWNNLDQYNEIGSVIHKCTPELDGGDVINYVSTNNDCKTREDVYNKLRFTSLLSWYNFLSRKLEICQK